MDTKWLIAICIDAKDTSVLEHGKTYQVQRYVGDQGVHYYTVRLHDGRLSCGWDTSRFELVETPSDTKITSDGGSTDYYKIPPDAKELSDLIEHKNMNYNVGNIFKAAYRLGEKAGNDLAYDLRKIIFFANRELNRIEKGNK